jgi:tetratricopeptide (TPR) repeat protein
MQGEPHNGLATLIFRMRFQISRGTLDRPAVNLNAQRLHVRKNCPIWAHWRVRFDLWSAPASFRRVVDTPLEDRAPDEACCKPLLPMVMAANKEQKIIWETTTYCSNKPSLLTVEVTCAASAFGKYRILREFGAWRFAERSLVQGLSVAPHALDLRVELIRFLAELGQSRQAVDEIRLALATLTDNNLALRDLGFFALRVVASGLAEECFRRSLAIDPDEDPRMLRYLGKAARRKGNPDEARTFEVWASSLSSGGTH